MAKARKKKKAVSLAAPASSLASLCDLGPSTPMQSANTIVRPVKDCKNGSKQKVRQHALDLMIKQERISKRQYMAGNEISMAYEAQFKSPPALKPVQVDTSPNPTASVAIQVDRASKHAWLKKAVPPDMREVVDHVCEQGHAIGQKWKGSNHATQSANLKMALDLVANRLGI